MDTNRRTIIGLALPIISAVFAVSLSLAAVAEPAADSSEGRLYAAAPILPQLQQEKAPRQFRSDPISVRNIQADRTISGSEPDPETFDKVGLETWWKRHQRASK
jgi:hypothetical protein